jgi:ribosome modulation factor
VARSINKPDNGIGHNGGVSEETFFQHLQAVVAATAPRDVAAANLRAVRKKARGDGVDLGKMDAMIKMSTWEPEAVRDHFLVLHRYAAWMQMPIGAQLDLFEGMPMAAKPALDWHAKGFHAATTKMGVPGTPPDDCPADQVQAWMTGWSEGQAKNAAPLGAANDNNPNLHVVQ